MTPHRALWRRKDEQENDQSSGRGRTALSADPATRRDHLCRSVLYPYGRRLLPLPAYLRPAQHTGQALADEDLHRQASASESRTPIKATYVGVDDTDTDFSGCVIPETRRWSNQHGAFENGYAGYCELWCKVVYTYAGLPYEGFCCAYSHGAAMANRDGPIPKGALIFSGVIPGTGKVYENDHRSGAFCASCGHYAGHVAIYVGDGYVAGSQVPYLQSIDVWISIYGYGGWSKR